MIKFLKEVFNHFLENNTFQKGAALGYYAVFSIIPIIVIVTSVLGILFGEEAVAGEINNQLQGVLGNSASGQIEDLIKQQHVNHNSLITSIIGFATLALSASGMFGQIHSAFNDIWNIKSKPKNSILNYFSKHFVSFSVLIALFLIMVISTMINTFLQRHSTHKEISVYWIIYEHLVSFTVLSIIFIIMFKFLGDAKVHWKPTVIGGLVTSFLFLLGKVGIGMYFGRSHVDSTFGSASVLALLMLWVYYISQIIFLGVSVVKVVSDHLGYEILPTEDAVKVDHVEL